MYGIYHIPDINDSKSANDSMQVQIGAIRDTEQATNILNFHISPCHMQVCTGLHAPTQLLMLHDVTTHIGAIFHQT